VSRKRKNTKRVGAGNRVEDKVSARTIAIEVLNKFNPQRNYAGLILDKLLDKTNERQRATDLVFGSIRNRLAIDTVIGKLCRSPVERIPAKLLNILRVGAYELIYSPATAEYSIVDEAAQNAKAVAGKKQVGFVNAVLRQITRLIINRQSPVSGENVTRTLPQTPATGCEFAVSFLPNLQTQPTDYLSAVFSLPKWLVADWLADFGFANTWQICLASNRRPSVYIRPNPLKTSTDQLAEKLRKADIDLEVVPDEAMIKIKSPRDVTQLPGFAKGEFTVQDLAAFEAVKILNPQPNWRILDLCAAPGTKTTQLAEMTGDKAKILATDFDAERLEKVKENVTRLGINSITVFSYQQIIDRKLTPDRFDCVLLDVPCSNTGVLARRIEVRYRIKQKAIKQLVDLQSELLIAAAESIKPQGKICYSTCSIQKEENSQLVKNFLKQSPGLELKSEKLILPSADGAADHDGGYIAILVRK
jgi:16S rRNA (cytosine967-C5)-methyltransferase